MNPPMCKLCQTRHYGICPAAAKRPAKDKSGEVAEATNAVMRRTAPKAVPVVKASTLKPPAAKKAAAKPKRKAKVKPPTPVVAEAPPAGSRNGYQKILMRRLRAEQQAEAKGLKGKRAEAFVADKLAKLAEKDAARAVA